MDYLICTVLVLLSGLFSGLTLGLLSLDTQSLRRRAKYGDTDAAAIVPIRQTGNLLLTTLLLGNVAVNTTLSIYLSGIASGLLAGLLATALIVVFGEVVPQAVISRYAIWFGARTIWFTRLALFLAYPIAAPIARTLDYFLGHEMANIYSHHELMDIISEHEDSEYSLIDADEERILHGALLFSHRQVADIMTAASQVVTYNETDILTSETLEEINEHGYSRLPIYRDQLENITGILYVKDLIVEQPDIAIKETEYAYEQSYLSVRSDAKLDVVLARMLKSKHHLAIVKNQSGAYVGIVTLEDIIEEIIQQEIEDEDDA